MNKKIIKIVNELNIELKKLFADFEGLYIYGSQINGIPNKDSDIDIVAILDASDKEKRYEMWGKVSFLEYQYNINIDLNPSTRQELERNYIYHNEVVNKGIFYAAF
ncbi:MAG: nucleotidyltransferase domain-containing protein [Elusimicrobiota bacterium]|jgi:DNA polymerase sigma|nr:nucleotidyltransferase domain-containing protein [Elusimicrobiota bacterium]